MFPLVNYAENMASAEDCSPEKGYLLGRSGEQMPKSCPPGQKALFEKSYHEGQQEFYQISLWQDTLNALDSEISRQEEQRREVDNEIEYLYSLVNQLKPLNNQQLSPSEDKMLSWAETEMLKQEEHRFLIDQEINRLISEKTQEKPWTRN
jgi:hypothetical protein